MGFNKMTKKISKKVKPKKKSDEKENLLDENEKKLDEYTDHLQRLQAEFENYRKRIEKEKEVFVKNANQDLIMNLLGVLDSFELAFKSDCKGDDFENGMKLIFSEMYSALEKEGLRKIECLGKKFDPNLHEVMLQEESEEDEGIILEELQKGYMLNNRVIRFSKVKVSKGGKKK